MSHQDTKGFVALQRSCLSDADPLWAARYRKPEWIVAFLEMSSMAAFSDHIRESGGVKVPLRRGEFVMSHSMMMKRFKMNRNKVRYFLTFLTTENHILEQGETTPLGTVYRIVNYGPPKASSETFHTPETNQFTPRVTPAVTPLIRSKKENGKEESILSSSSLERESESKAKSKAVASSFLGAKSKAAASEARSRSNWREALGAQPDRPVANRSAAPITTGANGGLERGLEEYADRLRAAGMPEEEIEQMETERRRKAAGASR